MQHGAQDEVSPTDYESLSWMVPKWYSVRFLKKCVMCVTFISPLAAKGALGLTQGDEKMSKSAFVAVAWAKKTFRRSRAENKEQTAFKHLQKINFEPVGRSRLRLYDYQLEQLREASAHSPRFAPASMPLWVASSSIPLLLCLVCICFYVSAGPLVEARSISTLSHRSVSSLLTLALTPALTPAHALPHEAAYWATQSHLKA